MIELNKKLIIFVFTWLLIFVGLVRYVQLVHFVKYFFKHYFEMQEF